MIEIIKEKMSEHFTKYHLKGLPVDAVLHHFTSVSNDEVHDHPFGFRSLILHGGYIEQVFDLKDMTSVFYHRRPGDMVVNTASTIHRITELPQGECWTLIFPKEKEREPGFYDFREDGVYHRFWNENEFVPYSPERHRG